jgi:hypothetical protein
MDENKRHHIDLVEAQILRMSENSKQMKTWCFALITGIIGIYVQTCNQNFLWIGIITILLFAWLDAYYLLLERKFRCVYNDIAGLRNEGEKTHSILLYGMPIHEYKKGIKEHLAPITSISIFPFYLIALAVVIVLLALNPVKKQDDIVKIQLTNSAISINAPHPIKIQGNDSIKIADMESLRLFLKSKDTLYVKNLGNSKNHSSISRPYAKE